VDRADTAHDRGYSRWAGKPGVQVISRGAMMRPMYASFREFYPYYLGEHGDRRCRRLHFLGSWLVIASVIVAIATRNPWWLVGAPLCGYGCAWIGHFAFEKNKPATFRHPVYSLMGDWVMFADILRGRVRI
jgi:hypothetical protein